MSLFRSSKAELTILPDQPLGSLYTPGAIVSGRVRLISPDDEHASSISINFIGRSKTYTTRTKQRHNQPSNTNSRTTIYYRDRAFLFSYTIHLFKGPYTLPANREHSWPFSFTFPITTREDRSHVYESAGSSIWLTAPHALPPNFQDTGGRATYATISYTLEANLERPRKPIQTELFLNFSPLRNPSILSNPQNYGLPFTHSSSRLQPGREDKRRSMKEALTDKFSSKVPSITFQVGATTPSNMVSSSAFPVALSLSIDHSLSTAEIVPAFTIAIREVYLECFTHIRAPRDLMIGIGFSMANEVDEIMESVEPLPFGLITPASETTDKGEQIIRRGEKDMGVPIEINVQLPRQVCPSFRSYAITRSYRLRIKARIECAGKEFAAKFDVPGFGVLPFAVARSGELAGNRPLNNVTSMPFTQQGSEEIEAVPAYDAQLPSYQDDLKK